MTFENMRVGDRITFRSPTRWSDRSVTRVVTGFSPMHDSPTVRFGGYPDFIVRRSEISAVTRKEK